MTLKNISLDFPHEAILEHVPGTDLLWTAGAKIYRQTHICEKKKKDLNVFQKKWEGSTPLFMPPQDKYTNP